MRSDRIRDTDARNCAKRAAKDSIFRDLFENPEYLLQLYQALHPEDKAATVDDIELVSIQNVLLNQMYNDLGFLVGKAQMTLLILLEVQSAWSINIIIRILLYLANTLKEYIEMHRLNVYGSKKLGLPKVEFYVIYTGESTNRPEWISLADEYFAGDDTFLDLKVRVIYDGEHGDIINQYVSFTQIYDEQIRLYGRTREAVLETIKICKDKDVLKRYLETRQKEVVDIMMTLFDQDYAWDLYVEEFKANLEEEVKKQVEEKVRANLKEEVKEEVRANLKEEFKEEVRANLKEEVKEEVRANLKEEVKEEVRANLKEEVREEVRANLKEEFKEEGKKEGVLNMRKRGFSNQDIADILNIETSKVEKWIAEASSNAQPFPRQSAAR